MSSLNTFNDDSFVYNPNEYVDGNAQTPLPVPGNYTFRATKIARKKNRDSGEEILSAKGWPTIVIQRVELVEPEDAVASYGVFQEIFTQPYMRKNGNKEVPAATHMDLLRALDQHAEVADFREGITECEKLLSSGLTFRVGIGYQATDVEWAKAEIARNGGDSCDKETRSKIWKDATLRTKDFKNPDGSYRTSTVGRTGNTLEAKLRLSTFVPSDKDVELGPYKR